MKKTNLFRIILIIVITIYLFSTTVFASAGGLIIKRQVGDIPDDVYVKGRQILGVIQVVANLIVVGTILCLGIKYMTGSVEEKAANKKTMLPLLVGTLLIFAAVNLVSVIYNWVMENTRLI